jgi:hypothetical protein
MNRSILAVALFAATSAALVAQQASQSDPYQGVSNPPADDTIITTSTPEAKPPAGHRAVAPPAGAVDPMAEVEPAAEVGALSSPAMHVNSGDGTDAGIVVAAEPAVISSAAQPVLTRRASAPDPDGDIVHPAPLPPGVLGEGTAIRVELMNELSSNFSTQGQTFRSRVASDVVQGDEVLIPAGAEIDGKVVEASRGHFGSYGTLQLRPETVILPGGKSYTLHATVSDAPDSNTTMRAEGVIAPGSQVKRDSIEYGGVVGGGAVTGALLGGPAGALAGSLIGAGLVTTHLLVSHPQASLDAGTTLILTVNENLHLEPASTLRN